MRDTILSNSEGPEMAEKIKPNAGDIIIVLTPEEYKVLKQVCMEVLGNYKWKVSRGRALILNKILDQLEEVRK